jgi:beta-glucosidase
MGLSPNLEGEEMPVQIDGFSGGDRTDIKMPLSQENLLKKLNELGKPIVLVLLNGSALGIKWAAENVPAIVETWYPGEAGGTALADVLFGDYNPAGRLPVTFYESVEDLPPFEDYNMNGRTYRFFEGKPLFPFGHGLSYTSFKFNNLQIQQTQVQAGDKVLISADITNSGRLPGDEVVQLYIRQEAKSSEPIPTKELKGFKRLTLQPKECQTITFELHVHQLGIYDEELIYAICPGTVHVMIGNSSENLLLAGSFEIVGQYTNASREKVFFSQVLHS